MLLVSGRASAFNSEAIQGGAISVRYRVERTPEQTVKLGMRCAEALCGAPGGASLDVTRSFRSAPLGAWQTLSVPLACLTTAGADLKDVEVPFALATAGRFGVVIADISVSSRGDGAAAHCP